MIFKNHLFTILSIVFLFNFLALQPVFAQDFDSQTTTIELDDPSIFSSTDESPPITPPSLKKEAISSQHSITIDRGISYETTKSFRFSLANPLLDFGELTATNPIIRNHSLSIYNSTAIGYSLFVSEDHLLSTDNNTANIPDTTCDNGQCNQHRPAIWENTLTYGFGFRCDNVLGNDCDPTFKSDTSYKQLPNKAEKENPVRIMAGKNETTEKKAEATYKVTIPGTQPPGSYTNTIRYLLVPGF